MLTDRNELSSLPDSPLLLRFINKGGEDGNDVAILDDAERLAFAGWYSNLNVSDSTSYREARDLAPPSRVHTGGPPCLMANSPIPASVPSMTCGMLPFPDHPLGSDCSRRVTWVVLGDRDSIDHPWRSIWVRMTVGSVDGGMQGKSVVSSIENPNRWTDEGDLYVVRSMTESRALKPKKKKKKQSVSTIDNPT